jgi:hypothetical protein
MLNVKNTLRLRIRKSFFGLLGERRAKAGCNWALGSLPRHDERPEKNGQQKKDCLSFSARKRHLYPSVEINFSLNRPTYPFKVHIMD